MRAYELLNEYRATPTALAKMAGNISAIAGFEMEMAAEDANNELEPDMSEDKSAYSISDITDFFNDWEHNSRNTVRYAQQAMENDFQEWTTEEAASEWKGEDQYDIVRQYILDNEYSYADLKDEWWERFTERFPNKPLPRDEDIAVAVEKMLQEMVQTSVDDEDEHYEHAKQEWIDNWIENEAGESEWLSSIGIDNMSDVTDHYPDLIWPHYTNSGEVDRHSIAEQIGNLLNKSAYASGITKNQHPENTYLVVNDSSVSNNSGEENTGFEIVSPPLSPADMLADYRRIVKWARGQGYVTNDTTGLHMNVSLEGFDNSDIDYVKLALLLGEEYMANLYDRFDTDYARSAIQKLEMRAESNPDTVNALLINMRQGLHRGAIDIFHNGWTDKQTSIHPHDGRVEFRFPGGNYLDIDPTIIETTLMRCIVVLDAACNPNKFRKEYLKKLYKLLNTGKESEDNLRIYVLAAAGEVTPDTVKRLIRARRQARLNAPKQDEEPFPSSFKDEDDVDHEAVQRALAGVPLDSEGTEQRDSLRARLGQARDA